MKHVLGTFEVEESEYASRFSKFENLQKILRRVAGMGGIGLAFKTKLLLNYVWKNNPRGHRDQKKRPGVDFFAKDIFGGLTN